MSPSEQSASGFQSQTGTGNAHKNVCACTCALTAVSVYLDELKLMTIQFAETESRECEKGNNVKVLRRIENV